ncbi:hypothetical protein Tco_0657767 [Tanacetum coccineum]
MDAIALTPCYPTFLITADVPEVYMHQFWNSMYKYDTIYRFKIDKKKRFFQICLRLQGREFDPLPSEEETVSFLRELGHTGKINSLNDVVVDQMHQPWRTFAALINRSLSGKTSGLDKLSLFRAQILWGMFHQKNVDYVELLWEDFIYQIENRVYKKQEKIPKMKESKAYKTYLGHATGVVPPKIASKFKKASPTKKDSVLVPVDKEPVTKGKRVKRLVKKSSTKPAIGVVIREPMVEAKSKGKEKEKVDVAHGKGIEMLSEVALTEKAQLKEVRKKSLRDFYMTHPSGSGIGAKKLLSVEKIIPTITSKGTGDKPGVPDVTEDDSTESESESWGNDEDDSKDDKIESDEDKGMDDTIDQFDDDVDARLEEPTQTGKEIVQGKGADVEMDEAQQGNENLETTQEQVVDDAHVTIITVTKKTEVPVTSSSRSSDLASKFLNFSDIPQTDAEIVSPLDVHVHHEVPRT